MILPLLVVLIGAMDTNNSSQPPIEANASADIASLVAQTNEAVGDTRASEFMSLLFQRAQENRRRNLRGSNTQQTSNNTTNSNNPTTNTSNNNAPSQGQ
jgi:hypothetical protein